jgi:cation transporter-like permease
VVVVQELMVMGVQVVIAGTVLEKMEEKLSNVHFVL